MKTWNIPIEGVCPVCKATFLHKQRPQGGGKHQIYCSVKCCQYDWLRGNAGKRKAAISKYDRKQESIELKRKSGRIRRLYSYGWAEQDFEKQLSRQNFKCYGCLEKINETTARIDHCHKTNKVRGLLCDHCNWALGHARDNPATLRRLMAFLEFDISKRRIYLIGALKNKRIPVIGNLLRNQGYDVMDEWFTPGEHADTNWQEYEKKRGRTYQEALRGRAATNVFLFDRVYLELSDAVILVAPAGKSAMLELGYSVGIGKQAYLFLDGEDPARYDIMPAFAEQVISTEQELLQKLKNDLPV